MIRTTLLSLATAALVATQVFAEDIRMAVTTSFHNSGLADVLLPAIKTDLDLDVHLVVVGTGQALRLGRAGDIDAILVHAKAAEEKFVSEGHGVARVPFMYNDFVLIGPATDPAEIASAKSAADALAAIRDAKAPFVSRGDDSGTHKKELSLWSGAGLDTSGFDTAWY
ncbi:MAG: sulfate ABC transporter substrate-binding protein, partial [Rhodobacteraceae bacterium]|nr:sulfate ABC transporter substrate-binding protein [Paracoccaceae bacterium]